MSHLDDETLSAHLDGEPVDGAEHLGECPECRARLDALRAVAGLVRAPVALPPTATVEAAVAAARAAPVVPLRPRLRGLTVLAAAAAVVVVLGSLAAFLSDDDGDGRTAAPTSDQVAHGGSALFEGGDLGDQSDEAELALRVKAAVEPAAADGAFAGGSVTTESAPAAATAGSQRTVGKNADPDCTQAVAREYATGLGALSYKASLRWKGTPAVALVYPVLEAKGPLDHRIMVMATDGCRPLLVQTI